MDRNRISDLQCEDHVKKINIIQGEENREPNKCDSNCHTGVSGEEGNRETTEKILRTKLVGDQMDNHANRNDRYTEVSRPMEMTDKRMDQSIGRGGEVGSTRNETVGTGTLTNGVMGEEETEVDDKLTEIHQYDNPVDEGWAWVVLIGCFGICMFIIGGLKTFGVLYVELAKKFQVSNQALSSVQSLAGFCYLFFGLRRDGFGEQKCFEYLVVEDTAKTTAEGKTVLMGYCMYFFTYATVTGRIIYLEDLFLSETYRRRGIGAKLFQAVAQIGAAKNCQKMQWAVHTWNTPSIEFYKKQGGVDMYEAAKWNIFQLQKLELEQSSQLQ